MFFIIIKPGTIINAFMQEALFSRHAVEEETKVAYSSLFSPFQIGNMKIANRIVKSAAGSYSVDHGINDQAMMFYENIARGGAGMIWFEDLQWYGYAADDVKRIVDKVHSYGTKIGMQTYGSWQFASSSKHLQSPLEMDMEEYRHTEQTVEQIHEVQTALLNTAVYAKACGFDALELNCSSDHMFDTFLSRFWNVSRTDEYSAESFENRARVVTELIKAIKEKCGSDFPIQILFNGVEENLYPLGDSSLCITPEEAQEFARLFEKAGADSLHIRSSSFGNHCAGFMPDIMHFGEKGNTGLGSVVNYETHFRGMVDGSSSGAAAFLKVAAKVKEAVSIPVGVVGSMDPSVSGEMIEAAIAEGKIDFIIINRPLLADPELPNKLKEGRKEDIRPCNRCVSCFKAVADMWGIGYCRVNPAYIRGGTEEMPEGARPLPAEKPEKILVIGGGPAGMEAAAIAAQRGHDVLLHEQKNILGGRIPLACAVKGSHDRMGEYNEFLQRRLQKLGVSVTLGVKVDANAIKDIAPNKVIIATGGIAESSGIAGSDSAGVYQGVVLDTEKLGETVCIIGGNIIAYDYAVSLTGKGKKVFLVSTRPESEIGIEQAAWPRAVLTGWMRSKGTVLYGGAFINRVSEGLVSIQTSFGTGEMIVCDSVVILEDLKPNLALLNELDGIEAVAVGDCIKPYNILEAVKGANLAARKI